MLQTLRQRRLRLPLQRLQGRLRAVAVARHEALDGEVENTPQQLHAANDHEWYVEVASAVNEEACNTESEVVQACLPNDIIQISTVTTHTCNKPA